MPKSKPTQVIVHRVELQEKERELLEQYVVTNTLAKGVPMLLIGGGIAGLAYIAYYVAKELYEIFDEGITDKMKRAVLQQIPVVSDIDDWNQDVYHSVPEADRVEPGSEEDKNMSYAERFEYNLRAFDSWWDNNMV